MICSASPAQETNIQLVCTGPPRYARRMAYNYDTLYQTEQHALGQPSAAFVAFFNTLDQNPARVLDLGCGQGRDALFIARLGHNVIGVDLSPAGIASLKADSDRETLDITAVVADIIDYRPDGLFDVIVIDRTLHMLGKNDRRTVLSRMIRHLQTTGYLLIADETSNMDGFVAELHRTGRTWQPLIHKGGLLFLQMDS